MLRVCGVDAEQLKRRKLARWERAVLAWALNRFAGQTQREIAVRLEVGTGAAVSHLLTGLRNPIDKAVAKKVERWRKQLDLLFKG